MRYAKEFLGNYAEPCHIVEPGDILYLTQQGKKQEAEDYLWKYCLFNPKNKKK